MYALLLHDDYDLLLVLGEEVAASVIEALLQLCQFLVILAVHHAVGTLQHDKHLEDGQPDPNDTVASSLYALQLLDDDLLLALDEELATQISKSMIFAVRRQLELCSMISIRMIGNLIQMTHCCLFFV